MIAGVDHASVSGEPGRRQRFQNLSCLFIHKATKTEIPSNGTTNIRRGLKVVVEIESAGVVIDERVVWSLAFVIETRHRQRRIVVVAVKVFWRRGQWIVRSDE